MVNVGNHQNPSYIPVELVQIQRGQPFRGELTTTQRQNIIKFSCRQPPDNFETIRTLGRNIVGISGNHFDKRNMKFSKEMVLVPGRCLDPPMLKYGNRPEKPQRGAWNLVGKQFTAGVKVDTWGVVWFRGANTRIRSDAVDTALETFKKQVAQMGMRFGTRVGRESVDLKGSMNDQNITIANTLRAFAAKKVDILLVLLPMGGDRIFSYVKWVADVKLGLANHCVLVDKFAKGNPQYMANNALKINLKLGGVNHTLDNSSAGILGQGKTMVVGIDATHPTPTDIGGMPTIASIVASTDGRLGQWPGEIRLNDPKREIMGNIMMEMMLGRLHRWKKTNNAFPENILIYRDGVSEGQYAQVVGEELPKIQEAIRKVYQAKPPKVTVLVVTKRHHVRFYPTSAADCDDKANCKNGTIVDRDVTRPCYWDFYLQAQAPLQGSARPAHYVVLHDEIFGQKPLTAADDIQALTHNICYMMARCTRSVSYGTPAFLADRYCDRGRKYVLSYYESKKLANPTSKKEDHPPNQDDVQVHPNLTETMVYI